MLNVKKNEDILTDNFDDGTVIVVHEAGGTAHVLNDVAALIYNMFDGGQTLANMEDKFVSFFDNEDEDFSEEVIRKDFSDTIQEFIDKKIIFVT